MGPGFETRYGHVTNYLDVVIRVVCCSDQLESSLRGLTPSQAFDSRIHLNDIYYPRAAMFEPEMIYALLQLQGLLHLFIDLSAVFLQLSPGTLLGLLASVGVWKDWVLVRYWNDYRKYGLCKVAL